MNDYDMRRAALSVRLKQFLINHMRLDWTLYRLLECDSYEAQRYIMDGAIVTWE